jgi:hypothetical protein
MPKRLRRHGLTLRFVSCVGEQVGRILAVEDAVDGSSPAPT